MKNDGKMRNRNAYSLEFVVCKPNHLDEKNCVLNEYKSSAMPLQEYSE
tara:strand:- start:322 stop:465 length:144 start_codon:yes stop_codon:yes gene_type:complete